jgi:hypothetical protein
MNALKRQQARNPAANVFTMAFPLMCRIAAR